MTIERDREELAELGRATVAAMLPSPTGRLVLQLLRGAAGPRANVELWGNGCTDFLPTNPAGLEVLLSQLSSGAPAAIAVACDIAIKLAGVVLPGQARLFNPSDGNQVLLDVGGIIRLGGPLATHPVVCSGDVITGLTAGPYAVTGSIVGTPASGTRKVMA